MSAARGILVLIAVAAGAQTACGPVRAKNPQPQDLVVLLPESDGTVGRAEVSNPAGKTELTSARASTRVAAAQAPSPATEVSESEVQEIFGDALSAQPPAPAHFTLYFQFDSEELTDESRALLSQVLPAVKNYPAPRVTVIGHTDTTGPASVNIDLGLRRASFVHMLLVETGLEASQIEVTSHGEAAPLVPTADETIEPRNRRVEITVR